MTGARAVDATDARDGAAEGVASPRIKAYLINLDRSPERLAAMTARLAALGLPWVRVAAVDGRLFGPLPWPGYDHRAYDRNWGKAHHPNEVGCYLSHVRALEAFLADTASFGLILEDDCVFDEDLPAVLDQLAGRAAGWDVVKLAGYHSGMPALVERLRNGRRLVVFLQRQTGSAAYLVNRSAAAAYLARLLPMSVPYDHAFDQVWRFGLLLRGVLPLPVHPVRGESAIGYGQGLGDKKPWYRRGSVLVYRARTETRRVLHYLFTDTRWLTRMFSPA